MAQTHQTPTPRAPASRSTSLDDTNVSRTGRGAFPSSHTSQINPIPNQFSPPTTPTPYPPYLSSDMGRRPNSKAPPSSRSPPTIKTPCLPSPISSIPTMNTLTSRIPKLLPLGYYQCSGISKAHSRCNRHVKNKPYCHSHDIQLLDAIRHDKDIVTRTITQVRSHKGPFDDKLADIRDSLLRRRHWAKIHIDNYEALLRNIRKGPLEKSERDQGLSAMVPRWGRRYICRGRGRDGPCCQRRVVGGIWCWGHDRGRITSGDVERAFASI